MTMMALDGVSFHMGPCKRLRSSSEDSLAETVLMDDSDGSTQGEVVEVRTDLEPCNLGPGLPLPVGFEHWLPSNVSQVHACGNMEPGLPSGSTVCDPMPDMCGSVGQSGGFWGLGASVDCDPATLWGAAVMPGTEAQITGQQPFEALGMFAPAANSVPSASVHQLQQPMEPPPQQMEQQLHCSPATLHEECIVGMDTDDDAAVAPRPATAVAHDQGSAGKVQNGQAAVSGTEEGGEPERRRGPRGVTPTPFEGWEVGPRYTLVRLLGHGSYGEVAEALDNVTGRRVAIKRIINVFENKTDARRIYREVYILRQLRHHPNVVTLLDVVLPRSYESFNDLYMVFEYVDTDLYKLILSPQQLTNDHIETFLYQMLLALKYLQSANVIHRDIKPANILLNEDCSLKFCDFGLARVLSPQAPALPLLGGAQLSLQRSLPLPRVVCRQMSFDAREEETALAQSGVANKPRGPLPRVTRQLTKHVVTRWYRAPELILLQDYSQAVDMWAMGCIFAELLSMQAESVSNYRQRSPLFPGKSCFPLSADPASKQTQSRLDQLAVIIDVIGTPEKEDLAYLGNRQRAYIQQMPRKEGRAFETLFRGATPEALSLLRGMLCFNPAKRTSVEEALNHPYLRGVRDPSLEAVCATPLQELDPSQLSKEDIKHRLYDEICLFAAVPLASPSE